MTMPDDANPTSFPRAVTPVLRCALFVDFDNIHIGLDQRAGDAARRFAHEPKRWVEWLEAQPAPAAAPGEPPARRRILMRRCYLNPQRFNKFRPFFIRAAFEVVDCPPLTQQGKNSADVRMVLDVVDALNHPTRFDEFILFSGDADFTPVLLRLRRHDRRSTVLTVGPAAAAYKAACDYLLAEETFIEEALGVSAPPPRPFTAAPPAGGGPDPALLAAIARRVQEVAAMTGVLQPWQLPAVYKEFPDFTRGENWLGYYSLRGLTDAVVDACGELVVREDEDWWVETRGDGSPAAVAQAAGDAGEGTSGALLSADDRARVAAFVVQRVGASDAPVALASLAQGVISELGDRVRDERWQRAGTFKAFLDTLDLETVELTEGAPGYAYDPQRHGDPESGERRDGFAESHPHLAELARAVSDVTDTPYLTPEQFAVVLEEIAQEVNEHGFQLTQTSKAVRDRLNAKGMSVSRADVGFLLKGLTYADYTFTPGEETPRSLGRQVALNTILLARRGQMALDEEDEDRILQWIVGQVRKNGSPK